MISYNIVFLLFLSYANCRFVRIKSPYPRYYVDSINIIDDDVEDSAYYPLEHGVKLRNSAGELSRPRRQVEGVMSSNPDGTYNLAGKMPLAGEDGGNKLSAVGSLEGLKDNYGMQGASGGLLLENPNGHSLSAIARHISGAGDQLTGSVTANLIDTDNHRLDATAFATRSIPKVGDSFNTFGGKMDYMYKDKIGGSLGMAHTDLFEKTDYSAMAKYNLFKTPSSSFDVGAGFQKSVSPYMPHSSWEPFAGTTYRLRF